MENEGLKNKNVLLFMPHFYHYDEVLKLELEYCGAKVYFVENKLQKFDYVSPSAKFRWIRKIYHRVLNCKWRYCKKTIDWTRKYDIFLCINGFSYDKRIIKILKRKNPALKTILYLWDSTQMFNWHGIVKNFDKAFTFDPMDAKKLNISYLANFYPKNIDQYSQEIKTDLFFIGTQHADRFNVISKLIPMLPASTSYYIKLFIRYRNILHSCILYFLFKRIKNKFSLNYCLNYELLERKISTNFLIYSSVDFSDIINNMQSARCILDIQSPFQVGIPHQMMLALAMGKKIITTNSWIINYSFYNPSQISIISRDTPIIDKEFLKNDYIIKEANAEIVNSRIDNWVNTIMYSVL